MHLLVLRSHPPVAAERGADVLLEGPAPALQLMGIDPEIGRDGRHRLRPP